MRPITAMERVEEQAPMVGAINSMVMWRLSSMLVTRGGEAVGVLRLTDVADKILFKIKECRFPLTDDGEERYDNLAA